MARVVVNKPVAKALVDGYAQGLADLGQKIIDDNRPRVPDAPPAGQGLVDSGTVSVYRDGVHISGAAHPPRGSVPADGVAVFVGYTDPVAHLLERGTVKMAARPFATPAIAGEAPQGGPVVAAAIQRELGKVKGH